MGKQEKPGFFSRLFGTGLRSPQRPRAVIDTFPWAGIDPAAILFSQQTLVGNREDIAPEFAAFAERIFKTNPVVYACIANRMYLFKSARFKYRRQENGRPGQLFGDQTLLPLENPSRGKKTDYLLALAELYVSLAGNFFAAKRDDGSIRVMRPDWVTLVLGSDSDSEVMAGDLDAEVIGYLYHPNGPVSGKDPITLLPDEVAHFMPTPDPQYPWRGMSWLTPLIRDIQADNQATEHKNRFWEGGATPNMIVKPDIPDPDEWDSWVTRFKNEHEGIANRYKTLFLAPGVDAEVVGVNFKDSEFVLVQSAGEVRICAAAMVPPAIVGVMEGLKGSALNQGNLSELWRQFANGWARPQWESIANAFSTIVPPPGGAELWYDDRDIPALAEDSQKLAEIQNRDAETINTLIVAGFEADSVVQAVLSNDFTQLVHSGLVSVQLTPPGTLRPDSNPGSSSEGT